MIHESRQYHQPCLECQDDDPQHNEAAPEAGQHVGALASDQTLHYEGHHQLSAAQTGDQAGTGQLQGPGVIIVYCQALVPNPKPFRP